MKPEEAIEALEAKKWIPPYVEPEPYREDGMSRLDKSIADVAYILDTLMAYRNIVKSGCCNDCRIAKQHSCEHLPKPGQLVRYNCPFYERKEDTDVNVKS